MITSSDFYSDKSAYDVIVIGGGLMGASTAAALSDNGKRVLVLEANNRLHTLGSSHGRTRVSRNLCFEATALPQMARDSLKIIRKEFPASIITSIPALFIAQENSPTHEQIIQFAHTQRVIIETLPPKEVKKQYNLSIPEGHVGILDEKAVLFDPDMLLDNLYKKIEASGGIVLFNTQAVGWYSENNRVSVKVSGPKVSNEIQVNQLVIAAGAWTPEVLNSGHGSGVSKTVLASLSSAMVVERIPVFYFTYPDMPDTILYELSPAGSVVNEGLPGGSGENKELWAGPEQLPNGTKALKVGFYYGNEIVSTPHHVNRLVSEREKAQTIAYVKKWFGKSLVLIQTMTCLNARATDKDMPLIGELPGLPNVYMIGHTGYAAKYALAFGKAISDTMQGRRPCYDMAEFSLHRITSKDSQ
jgi:glycine/D-amino acid oxidase-like deaminating enzyme